VGLGHVEEGVPSVVQDAAGAMADGRWIAVARTLPRTAGESRYEFSF